MPTHSERLGVGDNFVATLRDESGNAKEKRLSRQDLRVMSRKLDTLEEHEALTKEELKERAEEQGVHLPKNPSKDALAEIVASRTAPLGIGEILFEGEPHEVKGPGEEWETDAEGNYVNR